MEEALAGLPAEWARRLDNVAIVIEDEPDPADLAELGIDPAGPEPDLLGLYQGTPQSMRESGAWGPYPTASLSTGDRRFAKPGIGARSPRSCARHCFTRSATTSASTRTICRSERRVLVLLMSHRDACRLASGGAYSAGSKYSRSEVS